MDLRALTHPERPALGTVVLFGATAATYLGVWAAVLGGVLPLGAGGLLNVPLAYAFFTPLHEACHKNIRGRAGQLGGLEVAIGYLSGIPLLAPFPLFRVQHLRHHSFVNDPERDPDYWVRGEPGPALLARAATILPGHYWHFFRHPTKRAKELFPGTVALDLGMAGLFLGLARAFGWAVPLALWVLPGLGGLTLLALAFDWLPHHPHEGRGRYDNAVTYTDPRLDWPLLFQNYHLIHHLYPGIPFYRYKQAFELLRPELEAQGAVIREPGSEAGAPVV